jgi:hypothetical protein
MVQGGCVIMMKNNSIRVKRIEPVPGNSFTADWSSSREDRRIGNWVPDTHSTRGSTVAEFDIPLNFYELTAIANGYLDIARDLLKDRLGIDLDRYTIQAIKYGESSMKNGIKITHIATGYPQEVKLSTSEMRLATDNTNINESWQMLVESVYARLGIWIEGNYELETIIINGKERPLH